MAQVIAYDLVSAGLSAYGDDGLLACGGGVEGDEHECGVDVPGKGIVLLPRDLTFEIDIPPMIDLSLGRATHVASEVIRQKAH